MTFDTVTNWMLIFLVMELILLFFNIIIRNPTFVYMNG